MGPPKGRWGSHNFCGSNSRSELHHYLHQSVLLRAILTLVDVVAATYIYIVPWIYNQKDSGSLDRDALARKLGK